MNKACINTASKYPYKTIYIPLYIQIDHLLLNKAVSKST